MTKSKTASRYSPEVRARAIRMLFEHQASCPTIAEIDAWIRATPGQPLAIRRYQFIPSTLRDLVQRLGASSSARFDRSLQDRLALVLVAQARYDDFHTGSSSRSRFMDNLVLIWAGLPEANGKSAYHGYAGDRATITRTKFDHNDRILRPQI